MLHKYRKDTGFVKNRNRNVMSRLFVGLWRSEPNLHATKEMTFRNIAKSDFSNLNSVLLSGARICGMESFPVRTKTSGAHSLIDSSKSRYQAARKTQVLSSTSESRSKFYSGLGSSRVLLRVCDHAFESVSPVSPR